MRVLTMEEKIALIKGGFKSVDGGLGRALYPSEFCYRGNMYEIIQAGSSDINIVAMCLFYPFDEDESQETRKYYTFSEMKENGGWEHFMTEYFIINYFYGVEDIDDGIINIAKEYIDDFYKG